jgi:hypothetical protein
MAVLPTTISIRTCTLELIDSHIVLFPRPCCLRQRCRREYSNTDTTQATVPRPVGPWPAVIRLPTPPPLPMDSACPPSALIARLPYLTLTSANSPAATRHPGLQAFHTNIPQSSTPDYVHYSRCTFPLRMLWCHPNTTLMSAGSIGPEGSPGLHRARAKAHRIPRSHRITTGMAGLGLGSRRSWQKGNSSGRSSRYSPVYLDLELLMPGASYLLGNSSSWVRNTNTAAGKNVRYPRNLRAYIRFSTACEDSPCPARRVLTMSSFLHCYNYLLYYP